MTELNNPCYICPRNCGVKREFEKGFCGMGTDLKIAKTMLHMWEEPIISGTKGSGAIFFSGCSLKCIYCQNYKISSQGEGRTISVEMLSQRIRSLEKEGAHNINFVSPTHFTLQIIEALKIYRPKIPIVWNTSGYEKIETLKLIAPFVDIYLADFKYFNKEKAGEYSSAPDYPETACRALQFMRNSVSDVIENGLMKKGLIVRHLVLPKSTKEAVLILEWIKENLGKDTYVSIMNQYLPFYQAVKHPVLKDKVKPLEYKIVLNRFRSLSMTNGFMQDEDSANSIFVPEWNF